jgi:peroxiredoxin family protein
LTGEFNDYTKDNPKTKEPPCTYTLDESHEMDYNAFMMFISEKNLKPRKKESAEQLVEEQKQENMKLYNLKDFKINRHSLKSII